MSLDLKNVNSIAGNYESDRDIDVYKSLESKSRKDSNGNLIKTYGVWQNDKSNVIHFKRGVKVALSSEDLSNPSIKQLIKNGILKRVF